MKNKVICQKTETNSYGIWPAKESVTTTISLINAGNGTVGLSYDCSFNGVKSGHVHGGPYPVSKDENIVVNDSPEVHVIISEFNNTGSYVTLCMELVVNIPVIGSKTIYKQILEGSLC